MAWRRPYLVCSYSAATEDRLAAGCSDVVGNENVDQHMTPDDVVRGINGQDLIRHDA